MRIYLLLALILITSCKKHEKIEDYSQSNELLGSWSTGPIHDDDGPYFIRTEYGPNGKYFYSSTVVSADDDVVYSGTYKVKGKILIRTMNGITQEVSFHIKDGILYEYNKDKEYAFKRLTEQAAPRNR